MTTDNSTGSNFLRYGGCLAQFLTGVISITALVIATMSWRESRSSRLINQGSSRAVAYVTDVKIAHQSEHLAIAIVTVKNFGRSPAKTLTLAWTAENRERPVFYSDLDFRNPGTQIFEGLPPNYEKQTNVSLGIPIERDPQSGKRTYAYGILTYIDESSGESFNHKWCFEARVEKDIAFIPCLHF